MNYVLFFTWLIVLCWCLTKIRFVKNAGLSSKIIIALFLCKVAAGLLSGFITQHPGTDSWGYHNDALKEYHLLFSNPKEYFTNLFHTGYPGGYDGLFTYKNSYWNDLKTNLIIKLLSFFHIFSGGNFYINVILYNFLTFFGNIGLFRVFNQVYKQQKKLLIAVVFLLPSLLYYGSAIHKDGLVYAAIGVVIYNTYQALHITGFTFKRGLFIFFSLIIIFLFRTFVFIAIIPALTALMIAYKKKYSPAITFAVVYFIAIILFFNLHYLLPPVNLPVYVAERQADFLGLAKANTTIQINLLHPDLCGFFANAPQALLNGLCRPWFADISLSRLLFPLIIELFLYQFLIFLFIFFKKEKLFFNEPFVLFGLFFGLSVLLIIGYTVPVIGAIVRYRSIYLPFLLAPFICNISWEKLYQFIKVKK